MDQNRRQALAMIIHNARIIFFDDEESDSEILEKIENYAEYTVPRMNNLQFRQHFRMEADTFEDLLRRMFNTQQDNPLHPSNFPRTGLEKEVVITIWCLGNLESFRSIADRFGVSKATCWSILYRMCCLLLRVNRKYKIIVWPTRDRQHDISRHFQNLTEIPGIIGCIDGSHIKINTPKHFPNSYINRKNFHSLLLEGICDHKKLFTSVYTGEAGSIHDYTLYKRSDVYIAMNRGIINFFDDNRLIGDLAYKLNTNLLVGFKNNGHLTDRQKTFNYRLNKGRVTIENAFALLKGRFRRLKMLETVRLDLASLLIVSGCILHNICIVNGDVLDILDLHQELLEEIRMNPRNLLDINGEQDNNNAAIIKRNNLMNTLHIVHN